MFDNQRREEGARTHDLLTARVLNPFFAVHFIGGYWCQPLPRCPYFTYLIQPPCKRSCKKSFFSSWKFDFWFEITTLGNFLLVGHISFTFETVCGCRPDIPETSIYLYPLIRSSIAYLFLFFDKNLSGSSEVPFFVLRTSPSTLQVQFPLVVVHGLISVPSPQQLQELK